MAQPRDGDLLRYIAEHEQLDATVEEFGLRHDRLAKALLRAAELLDAEQTGPSPANTAGLPKNVQRVRVYSDGAARGNPGPAGAGAVLVAPSGQVVERLGKFLGNQTNNFAEYTALILGLQRAYELGVSEVEVFADSELMIRQLSGRYQVRSPSLRPLYEQALKLLKAFSRVKLVHVPREMNQAADEMSNKAIDERL